MGAPRPEASLWLSHISHQGPWQGQGRPAPRADHVSLGAPTGTGVGRLSGFSQGPHPGTGRKPKLGLTEGRKPPRGQSPLVRRLACHFCYFPSYRAILCPRWPPALGAPEPSHVPQDAWSPPYPGTWSSEGKPQTRPACWGCTPTGRGQPPSRRPSQFPH